jgi:hypothetical protein
MWLTATAITSVYEDKVRCGWQLPPLRLCMKIKFSPSEMWNLGIVSLQKTVWAHSLPKVLTANAKTTAWFLIKVTVNQLHVLLTAHRNTYISTTGPTVHRNISVQQDQQYIAIYQYNRTNKCTVCSQFIAINSLYMPVPVTTRSKA